MQRPRADLDPTGTTNESRFTTVRLRSLVLVLLASCSVSVDDHAHDPDPGVYYDESEPNDAAEDAAWFGPVAPGTHLAIAGDVTEVGFDLFDGFAFTAIGPCVVEFSLHAFAPGADLDVCVYDPELDLHLACYESPYDPELGALAFAAGARDFQLVVSSSAGASSYVHEVDAFESEAALAAQGSLPVAIGGTLDDERLTHMQAYRPAVRGDELDVTAPRVLPLEDAGG